MVTRSEEVFVEGETSPGGAGDYMMDGIAELEK